MDSIGIDILKGIVFIYDAATLPIYFLVQKPWKKKKSFKGIRGTLSSPADPSSLWIRVGKPSMTLVDDCKFVHEIFSRSVEKYRGNRCLGSRSVLVEEHEKLPDGSLALRKTLSNDCKWMTYNHIDKRVDDVMKGMISSGIKPSDYVLVYMETRMEWMIMAQSVFRLGAILVTVYPTIDDEGLIQVVEESKLTQVATSSDLLPKIKRLRGKNRLSSISTIIYVEDHLDQMNGDSLGLKEYNINCIKFTQVENIGAKCDPTKNQVQNQVQNVGKSTDEIAMVMYTAGTSGPMKGVMLSHGNILSAVRSMTTITSQLRLKGTKDVSVNYLPLASSFEFILEHVFLISGVGIGYSSPSTLTDLSPSLKAGTVGDINVIEPRTLLGVPLILDRLKKGINEQVANRGSFFHKLFHFSLEYKQYWTKKGYRTPIVNMFFCSKIRSSIGGHVKSLLINGGPLSSETQSFSKACLDIQVLQGYGTTESLASVTFMDPKDSSTGRVGAPLFGVQIKLSPWKSFTPNDKPHPRGEILVSGPTIAQGYLANEPLTKEHFVTDSKGHRCFKTGDIGEIFSDGTLKIIDRKNHILTLDTGEVLSLGKIEAELKSCPFVDNICIQADPGSNFSIALVSPNHEALIQLCSHLGIEGEMIYKDMCNDPEIQAEVMKAISEHGLKAGLKKSEIPRKIKLCFDPWTPESGLVTSTLSVRREKMVEMYKKDINRMFGITDYNRNVFEIGASGNRERNQATRQETRVEVEIERIEERVAKDQINVQMEPISESKKRSGTQSTEGEEEWREAETEQSYM